MTRRALRLPILPAAVLAAAAGLAVDARAAAPGPCEVPERILSVDADLPHARAQLKAGKPLSILIVNSARGTTQPPAPTYPTHLATGLREALPGREIAVQVLSFPGETAETMIAPLKIAVKTQHPGLVVWQTGTVDAMRGVDPEAFSAALTAGIDAVHALGADLLVMDMQYSPQTAQIIDFAPYVKYVGWASQNAGVFRFPRYDIMQYWVESGSVDFGSDNADAQRTAFDFVHRCVGTLLADSIAAMVKR